MKTTAVLVAATAALSSAQVTYNQTTGKYTCAQPNVAYCAGDSLQTDIIIRCDANGIGQPGRCSDNLAGEPPLGVKPALCYQTSLTAGDAACEKNCVVYGGSGNGNGTFTLPTSVCKPDSTVTSTSISTPIGTGGSGSGGYTTLTTVISGVTTTYCPGTTTAKPTTTYVPPPPISTGTGGAGGGSGNGTCTKSCGGGSGSATNTPVGPTKTTTGSPTTIPTAGAVANRVGGALAVVGVVAAYFL